LKLSTEPDRSVPRAVPAPAVEAAVLIAPDGVNTSLKEVPTIGSAVPCQTPWKATTQPWGSWLGVPPVRLMLVREPLVEYQACTAPVRSKV
jgi:hypothetical protein